MPAGKVDPEPGVVVIGANSSAGWFLVQIGRGRYTKRFNLSDNELRQIAAWADEHLAD